MTLYIVCQSIWQSKYSIILYTYNNVDIIICKYRKGRVNIWWRERFMKIDMSDAHAFWLNPNNRLGIDRDSKIIAKIVWQPYKPLKIHSHIAIFATHNYDIDFFKPIKDLQRYIGQSILVSCFTWLKKYIYINFCPDTIKLLWCNTLNSGMGVCM